MHGKHKLMQKCGQITGSDPLFVKTSTGSMESMEKATEAVKSALDTDQLPDEAIIEYLSGLCLSAASDGDFTPLIEAIEDCTPPTYDLVGEPISASERGRRMVARLKGEEPMEVSSQAPNKPAPNKPDPATGKSLSIKASEFKPRQVSQPPSTFSTAPTSSGIPPSNLDIESTSDLLSSWFPGYSSTDLQLLYESLGNNLWLTVEELQIMEGEEPYSTRFNLPRQEKKAPGQVKAPSISSAQDFPSLSGSKTSVSPASSSKDQARSAKDALLLWPPHAASTKVPQCSEASSRTSNAFWKQSKEGGGSSQADAYQPVAWLEGSIPVVATGAQLTALYEESRAEARERMMKRAECFRLAAHAYASGHRWVTHLNHLSCPF